ncbi:MAG: ABC transporter ATP-binding protein [Thermodesulfovibrionales bacterium]|nr:ABC transporter ATP-binding protein [Thermodesulfovibrionales bacterium]
MADIEIQNLSFSYKHGEILKNISANFKTGVFTGILGKNGSGKTTLLKIIAGLLPYNRGKIKVNGIDIKGFKDTERAKIIGYLPQSHHPTFAFKVIDVVLTGRFSYVFTVPKNKDIERAEEAMDIVGIGHLKERIYTELSGGERQMVMMARLLCQGPEIMLLDEPLTHLDLPNQVKMWDIINRLIKRNHTVIAVLHDITTALRYAKHLVFMKDGRVVHMSDRATDDSIVEKLKEVFDIDISIVQTQKGMLVFPI